MLSKASIFHNCRPHWPHQVSAALLAERQARSSAEAQAKALAEHALRAIPTGIQAGVSDQGDPPGALWPALGEASPRPAFLGPGRPGNSGGPRRKKPSSRQPGGPLPKTRQSATWATCRKPCRASSKSSSPTAGSALAAAKWIGSARNAQSGSTFCRRSSG